MVTEAEPTRETMAFDVVIVGAGPAGLAAAIRLKQVAAQRGESLSVCIVEKGSEVGAHTLSGAILEPRALDELLPRWRDAAAAFSTPVSEEAVYLLTRARAFKAPGAMVPPAMRNHGNVIVRLGLLCRWLAEQAEALGVEIFPGFAAASLLSERDGRVSGVVTGDMGLDQGGAPGPGYQPGVALCAPYTLLAEGCRGHLAKEAMRRFRLNDASQPQTYGIGLKELWEVEPARHRPGRVVHTAGWPLDPMTYGGSFLYHLETNLVAVGLVVGLDYRNPTLSPFQEFQRLKTHPVVRKALEGGRRIGYGARALNEGGVQSLPKLVFPGGALIGCDAGTLNVAKIKGIHTAMKSGMLAGEAAADAILGARRAGEAPAPELHAYAQSFRRSWAYEELHRARNFRPGFRLGLLGGALHAGLDQLLMRGRAPWTLRHHGPDHTRLKPKRAAKPIAYPKPDGRLTFDIPSSVYLTGVNHREGQPCHLRLTDETIPIAVNLAEYDAPEQRYCPAAVYEIVVDEHEAGARLQINAQNCIHCKTCDIKDPRQNIHWTVPEGGDGPNYAGL